MKDQTKTKEQLIDELAGLRRRVAELEAVETGRKQAEEALRGALAELTVIQQNVPIAMMLVDRDRRVHKVNEAASLFAGRPGEEMLGLRSGEALRCLHHLDDPQGCGFGPACATCAVRLAVLDTFASHESKRDVEAWIPFLQGDSVEERCLLISTAYLQMDDAERMLVCAQDITERKQAEKELQHSNELLRAIIEAAPTAIIGLDLDGNVQMVWNPAAEKMLGWSAQEVMGHPLPSVPTESQEEFRGFRERIRRGETLDGVEVRRQRRDGSPIDYSIYASPLRDAESRITGNVAVLVDITERKRVEEERARAQAALRESEELLRVTLENILDPIFITNDVGEFTYICSNVPNALGYSVEEIRAIGNISRLIRGALPLHQGLRALGEIRDIEGIIETKSGDTRDFLISAKRVSIGDGTILYSCHDITERKKAQDALQVSQQKLHLALEGAIADSWEMDLTTGTLTFSDRWAQHMGYEPDEIAQTMEAVQGIVHPDDLQGTFDDLNAYLRGETPLYETECRLRRKDGDYTWVVSRGQAVTYNREGHPTRLIGTNFDITERKQAEEAYRASVSRFKELFNKAAIPLCFTSKDKEGTTLHFNAHFEKTFGYSHKEVPTLNEWWQLAYPDPVYREWVIDTCYAAIQRAVETESDIEPIEYRVTCKNGDIRTMVVYGSFIGDELLLTFFNITERKQAEQERLTHLRFLESMDQVNRAIQGTNDLEQMMSDVLDVVLNIFDCDRASLIYPCDPETASWKVPMERTRPEYPGAHALGIELPTGPDVAQTFRIMRASDGPVKFGPESEYPLPAEASQRFGFQSFIGMALYPKVGKPWEFVLHQCSYPRVWTPQEERLFQEIVRRLADGLTSLLVYRDLQESELRYREIFENTSDAIVIAEVTKDGRFRLLDFNPAWETIIGLGRTELVGRFLEDLSTDETARTVLEQYHVCLEKKAPIDFETGLVTATGHWYLHTTLIPVSNAAGNIYRLVGVSRNITERKRAEEERARAQAALRESEELLRITLENILDPIFITDDMGEFTYICSNVPNALGYSVEEIRAMGNISLLIRGDLPLHRELYALEEIRDIEGIIETKSSDIRDFLISAKRVSIGDGTILYSCHDITERKQAEEALRASEERFSKAFRLSPMGMAIFRAADGRFVDVNDVFTQISGYSREEIIGRTTLELQLYANPQERDSVLQALQERGRLDKFEFRVRTKSGEIRDGLSATTEIDLGGEKHYLSLVLDITERKRAEEALRQSEERFRALYEDNPSMYFTLDAQGTVLSVNPFGADQLGYAVEELIGQSVLNVFYPDDRKAVQQQLMACLEHPGQVAHWEFRKVRQDGSLLWVREAARAVQGADGRPVVLVVCEDITESRRAEAEREHLLAQVREQARRVQGVVDTVPEGVLLLDANCRVVLTNPLGQKDLATLAGAQVGDTLTRLGDRPLEELLTSPPKGLWHKVATKSRNFQVIARPVENDATPEGWVLVIRDVTQQYESERRVQQQERLAAVGQLAAGIAHDFNNIMAVIVLYAQMTARSAILSDRDRGRLAIINEQAHQATRLIQQILDFSRQAVLERQPLDLLPLLKEQVQLLERTLPEHIAIQLDYGHSEYTVNADPTRMQQMVMNLAVNARDAMPEGGVLRIALERITVERGASPLLPELAAGDWIRLSIADTGIGIPPKVLPHIFEPFYTTKPPNRGSGLGLAQVHGIVAQHEGRIDVETQVGAGTTFTIYLPAMEMPPTVLLSPDISIVPQGKGEVVMVVEDSAPLRATLRETLTEWGYQVREAADGVQALTLLEELGGVADLVLSDVVMPEMGGVALVHALRERGWKMPVILLSGYPQRRDVAKLNAYGVSAWLSKPLNMEELAEAVAQALSTD